MDGIDAHFHWFRDNPSSHDGSTILINHFNFLKRKYLDSIQIVQYVVRSSYVQDNPKNAI